MLAGVPSTSHIDYVRLAAAHAPTSETWDAFVRDVLVDQWLAHYARVSDWRTQVLEIAQGKLTFFVRCWPDARREPSGPRGGSSGGRMGLLPAPGRQARSRTAGQVLAVAPVVVWLWARSRPLHRPRCWRRRRSQPVPASSRAEPWTHRRGKAVAGDGAPRRRPARHTPIGAPCVRQRRLDARRVGLCDPHDHRTASRAVLKPIGTARNTGVLRSG